MIIVKNQINNYVTDLQMDRQKIYLRLKGGLGNQLFIYSYEKEIQIKI